MRICHSLILSMEGLIFTTVNPPLPEEMDFLIRHCRCIYDQENVHTPPKLGRYWEIIPVTIEISLEISLGKSLGHPG